MMIFSLWKQLKRRIRRQRRSLWTLGGISLFLFVSIGAAMICMSEIAYANGEIPNSGIAQHVNSSNLLTIDNMIDQPSISNKLKNENEQVQVMLQRIFVCGEEIELIGEMASKNVIRMLQEHPEWNATLHEDGKTVMLQQRIHDLSSHCKSHAYFGVDKHGNFSLFDGIPREEKVMRTFFQLDIHFMESSLPQDQLDQLMHGIRVNDIEEYNSVLSTFSDYAIEYNEKTMKHAY
ncbi:BofC C-terminal domain-containing protein [Paenibacillus sp. GSMTC-2017]|uniref:BofC C-terminal domain-containing protein n=1 Tax=Paenibacillus sp. GSMTC-2017 TaxID=2794350 RepID=UPI0018D73F9B|nr:BofC C-terminal domain-containing protein [Paenibacillus sp. GSMTC-2017]MBH5317136.1 BofC C-terminal domain-containing protein [Paenibacillus sp. GSMTC-2017]